MESGFRVNFILQVAKLGTQLEAQKLDLIKYLVGKCALSTIQCNARSQSKFFQESPYGIFEILAFYLDCIVSNMGTIYIPRSKKKYLSCVGR